MGKQERFTDEFKRDAVAQVVDRGYPVREVAKRLGISTKSIYTWQKLFSRPAEVIQEVDAQADEIRRLKRDLARVTEERDILKKATVGSNGQRNGSIKGFSGRLEAKRLSGPRVEPQGNLIEVSLGVDG